MPALKTIDLEIERHTTYEKIFPGYLSTSSTGYNRRARFIHRKAPDSTTDDLNYDHLSTGLEIQVLSSVASYKLSLEPEVTEGLAPGTNWFCIEDYSTTDEIVNRAFEGRSYVKP